MAWEGVSALYEMKENKRWASPYLHLRYLFLSGYYTGGVQQTNSNTQLIIENETGSRYYKNKRATFDYERRIHIRLALCLPVPK